MKPPTRAEYLETNLQYRNELRYEKRVKRELMAMRREVRGSVREENEGLKWGRNRQLDKGLE